VENRRGKRYDSHVNIAGWIRNMFGRRERASASKLETGIWGEQVAGAALEKKGYKILGRRVKIKRDELDLVTRSPDGVLVFVEVKTRATEDFGRPFDAIDQRKRRALSRAAWRYLLKLRPRPEYFRFDVVEVIGSTSGPPPLIRHIENAFSMMGRKRLPW
jgi:putative endonuclease